MDNRSYVAVCDLPACSSNPSIKCMQKRFDQPAMGNLITFEAAARTGSHKGGSRRPYYCRCKAAQGAASRHGPCISG